MQSEHFVCEMFFVEHFVVTSYKKNYAISYSNTEIQLSETFFKCLEKN